MPHEEAPCEISGLGGYPLPFRAHSDGCLPKKQAQNRHSGLGSGGCENEGSRVEGSRGQFRTGRAKTGGRRPGTPNRVTRAAKEFLTELLADPDVQDAIRARILEGDTAAFFRAMEMVYGKPRQSLELNQSREWVIALPPGDDVG